MADSRTWVEGATLATFTGHEMMYGSSLQKYSAFVKVTFVVERKTVIWRRRENFLYLLV
jgi:hypothetical protein